MIASGLLDFRHCCALRFEGKSQVGIISRAYNALLHYFITTSYVCLCWQACTLCTLLDRFRNICPATLCLLITILFIMG